MFGKSKRPICPQLGKPCIREQCAAWRTDILEEAGPAGSVTRAHSACEPYFWAPLYRKGIANRTDGTQRAVESMRNETTHALASVAVAANTLSGLITEAQRLAALLPAPRAEREIAG